jgi:hypothetical protein
VISVCNRNVPRPSEWMQDGMNWMPHGRCLSGKSSWSFQRCGDLDSPGSRSELRHHDEFKPRPSSASPGEQHEWIVFVVGVDQSDGEDPESIIVLVVSPLEVSFTMLDISVDSVLSLPVGQRRIEIVERKGRGHPDSICDALMDTVSVALCAAYIETAGRVLHHNLDKGLLVAGQTAPGLGGGTIQTPMRIIFGDRATHEWQERKIPVGEIVANSSERSIPGHRNSSTSSRGIGSPPMTLRLP